MTDDACSLTTPSLANSSVANIHSWEDDHHNIHDNIHDEINCPHKQLIITIPRFPSSSILMRAVHRLVMGDVSDLSIYSQSGSYDIRTSMLDFNGIANKLVPHLVLISALLQSNHTHPSHSRSNSEDITTDLSTSGQGPPILILPSTSTKHRHLVSSLFLPLFSRCLSTLLRSVAHSLSVIDRPSFNPLL